jgi:cytochrome c551
VTRRKRTLVVCLLSAAGLAACGKSIEVPQAQSRLHEGATLFNMRCGGCHTLDAAATSGSKSKREVKGGERTNGPNFNVRREDNKQDVLFAIRNGGFSGAIMPANIVVGEDAQKVAEFLVKFSGKGGESSDSSSGQSASSAGPP